jgi:hypothetical protein
VTAIEQHVEEAARQADLHQDDGVRGEKLDVTPNLQDGGRGKEMRSCREDKSP